MTSKWRQRRAGQMTELAQSDVGELDFTGLGSSSNIGRVSEIRALQIATTYFGIYSGHYGYCRNISSLFFSLSANPRTDSLKTSWEVGWAHSH